ncbi:MAG TPA: mannosyltransferase family protein [Chloroflexota bacterium]|nr:mannosyltransferase family protein [Chloroflexota bacterium]
MFGTQMGVGALQFLTRWDAGWWLMVAREGYPSSIPMGGGEPVKSQLAFFPLFPALARLTSTVLPVSVEVAAILVSLAAGAIAVVLIHRIALLVTTPAASRRAVVLFSFFPGSMVLTMSYSEGLMIALCAGCLLALLQERWGTAGVCALLATASRASALAIVPACLWQAVRAYRRGAGLRPLLAPALAPLGTLAFFGLLWARTGEPLAYLRAEEAWGSGLGLARAARVLLVDFVLAPFSDPLAATATLALLFAVVAGVILARRRGWPAVLSVYTFSLLAISVSSRMDGLRARDVLTAFPVFLALGDLPPGRWYRWAIPAFAGMLVLSLLCHQIGTWGQP